MKRTFLSFATLIFVGLASTPSLLAQNRNDHFIFSQEKLDTLVDENRITNFVEEILQRIETDIHDRMREGDRGWRDDEDSTGSARRIRTTEGAVTFTGNTSIDETDKIEGNVVVKGGTLTVLGLVQGDALAINGDIIVKEGGKITGNARAINGKVVKQGTGIVEGYTEESSSAREAGYPRRSYLPKRSLRFNEYWLDESLFPDNFVFRYNRVEGLFLGLGSEKRFYWDGSRTISGYGSAGYTFKVHRWRMNLGLDRQFTTDNGLYEIGLEGHSLTDTKDEWIMKLGENNAVALLWHEDYRDYFTRQGFAIHIARYSKERSLSTQFRVDYLIDDYSSLEKQTDWSVFRPSYSFRENPAVKEGTMHSVVGSAGISTLEREGRRTVGWNVYANAERGGGPFGGDFKFTQVIVDVRRFQPITDYDNINVRLRVGSLQGDTIRQKTFELGGANTLPAYSYKEFGGNRMILGNFEYILSGRVFDDVSFWPNSLNFMLLVDAGATPLVSTTKDITSGFSSLNQNTIKSDVGFGVGWHDESWRLGFVWRTDVSAPVSVFFRFNKPF